jgi:hypothetical protein
MGTPPAEVLRLSAVPGVFSLGKGRKPEDVNDFIDIYFTDALNLITYLKKSPRRAYVFLFCQDYRCPVL